MKIILVSSTITYIPDNYFGVLKSIIKKNKNIKIIFLLKINRTKLLKKILLLFLAGAFNLSYALFKNLIKDFFNIKQKKLEKLGVKVVIIDSVNEHSFLNFIKKNNIDLIFNLRARGLYKKEILKIVKVLNVHHGILPKNRGLFSDMRNLAFENTLGFSIHKVNEKIDDGSILKIEKINYNADKNYLKYLKFSSDIESTVLSDFIFNFKNEEENKNNNISKDIVFYKNPTWNEIKKMKKNGLVL